jgi:hypothetical protein
MIYRMIIAKVYHDRMREFITLVKDKWAPMLEAHGGKFLGIWKNNEPGTHEVVGLMRFDSEEQLLEVNEKLAHDERFGIINAKMRPMLQSNEIRILVPV